MGRGKYAKVIDTLARAQPPNYQYQEKVKARKEEIRKELGEAFSPSTLTSLWVQTRYEKEEHEKKEKAINLDLEALTQLVSDQYEIEGLSSVRLDSGESVSIQFAPYAVVKDREKARLWAVANGLENELQLPWQTLNSHMSEMLLQGEAIPEGIEIFSKSKLVLRGKNKPSADEEEIE